MLIYAQKLNLRMFYNRAGQTTARGPQAALETNLCGPPALAECMDYVSLYHRVLSNIFIAINMTNSFIAPTSPRSCGQPISRKIENVPHVFNWLPTPVRCSSRSMRKLTRPSRIN